MAERASALLPCTAPETRRPLRTGVALSPALGPAAVTHQGWTRGQPAAQPQLWCWAAQNSLASQRKQAQLQAGAPACGQRLMDSMSYGGHHHLITLSI